MQFEGREVHAHANYVADEDLRVGEIYFQLSYVDERLVVPELTPLVFLGKDVLPEAKGKLVFQDAASYLAGYTLDKLDAHPGASEYIVLDAYEVGKATVLTYEEALNGLLRTSLERRKAGI